MKIAKDKIYHTLAGLVLSLLVGTATKNPALGLVAAIAAGFAKEVWDHNKAKKTPDSATPDWKDAAFTFGGGALGGLMVWSALAYGTL